MNKKKSRSSVAFGSMLAMIGYNTTMLDAVRVDKVHSNRRPSKSKRNFRWKGGKRI